MNSKNKITLANNKNYKSLLRDQRVLLGIIIIIIIIFVSIVNKNFVKPANILSLLQQISVLGLLTMGMAKLMLSGGIDLSIGNIMILSACVMSVLISGGRTTLASGATAEDIGNTVGLTSVPVAVIIGLLVAVAAGALNGLIVSKTKTMPLIITLGMSSVYYGIALIITGGAFHSFMLAFEGLRVARIANVIPMTLIIFFVMVGVAFVLVNRTKFGRRIVAIGGNEAVAFLSGIKVDRHKIITYTISGFFCGIAAILYATRLNSVTAGGGAGYELNALTACVVGGITFDGGKGSIVGAFLGVFFMGLINNVMNILSIDSYYQTMISGLIIVAAVILSNLNRMRRE